MSKFGDKLNLRRETIFSRRFLSLLLVVILLLPLFLSACSASRGIAVGFNGRAKYPLSHGKNESLSSLSLVQAIAASVNKPNEIPEIFASIPKAALDGLQLDEYLRYIQALSSSAKIKISSFTRLDPERQQGYSGKIGLLLPALAVMAARSDYYILNILGDVENASVVLAVQTQEDGTAFLSRQWVKKVLALADFSQLYYSSLDTNDHESLSWLLSQGAKPFESGDGKEFFNKKAKLLLNYYDHEIQLNKTSGRPTVFLPAFFRYQYEYRATNYRSVRICEFNENAKGISVLDPVPDLLQEDDTVLRVYGEDFFLISNPAMKMNPYHSSTEVNPIVGPMRSAKRVESSEEGPQQIWEISYYGITLTVKGAVNAKQWSGRVERIVVDSRIYSFGSVLRIGLPLNEFYGRYPFAAESSFILKRDSGSGSAHLAVQSHGDLLNRLVWSAGDN